LGIICNFVKKTSMTPSIDTILKALSTVIDPDLKRDLVSLNMIQHVHIDGNIVRFTLVLTTPACPLKNFLQESCIQAIHKQISPDLQVDIIVTSKVTERKRKEQELENLKNVKNIIAVVSGKGGVGKSTVSANLAVALAMDGASVGLVDGDIYGPSMPIMFGLEGQNPQVNKNNTSQTIEPLLAFGVKVISIGFFVAPETSLMWRGPMASNYLKQLITDTEWGALDYLIFDMPPGTGDMHLTLVQTVPVSGVVVVSTPQNIALADARKAVSMFKDNNVNVPILGMVENMSFFSVTEIPNKKYYIFGKEGTKKLAESLKLPLLGEIPIDEEVCVSGDAGIPIVVGKDSATKQAFINFARKTAQAVSIRNAELPPTNKINIK
jgi:ATP-binding protein involved in chromosome partitioning